MVSEKQLVLQFRIEGHGSVDDFDRLVEIEEKLDSAIRGNAIGYVDGHDMGSGEVNIFIYVETWEHGISFMGRYVSNEPWAEETVLAKRNLDDTYEVVWPAGFTGEFKIT